MFNLSVNYIVSLNISHQRWNGRKGSKEDENPSKSVHNLNCTWCSFPPATVECVVFIITYFYSLIFIKFMTICAFLWLGKLCFQFTNIICVMAQFRHEGKLEGGGWPWLFIFSHKCQEIVLLLSMFYLRGADRTYRHRWTETTIRRYYCIHSKMLMWNNHP